MTNDTLRPLKALSDQIAAKRAEIDAMHRDSARCAETIRTANRHDEELAALRFERQKLMAEAYLTGKKASTTEIDAQIAKTEEQAAKALADGAAARTAAELLKGRMEAAKHALSDLKEQRRTSVQAYLHAAFSAAEGQYCAAGRQFMASILQLREIGDAMRRTGKPYLSHQAEHYTSKWGLDFRSFDGIPQLQDIAGELEKAGCTLEDLTPPPAPTAVPTPPHIPEVRITQDGVDINGNPQHAGPVIRQAPPATSRPVESQPQPVSITRRLA